MTFQLDDQDIHALRALDPDFEIKGDTAKIACHLEVEITRETQDLLRLTIHFPGQRLEVKLRRAQFLQEILGSEGTPS